MLDRASIEALIPHQGGMCLLDEAVSWDADRIVCRTGTHLSPANPLRRDGRLAAVCGIEYGLQAAALHGALMAGGVPQRPGYLAALRGVKLTAERLDHPALGILAIEAALEASDASGLIYSFRLSGADGQLLVSGRAVISLPS